ncbi:MAG: hypothetical protein FWD71_22330 [Oscillospiraceae bacterium]|nr:hypothetical protein [Oscillospiraceae bacterium]
MYNLPQSSRQDYRLTSNTPSWLNFAANIIITVLTMTIIMQNNKIIELNEKKVRDDKENLQILQEIKNKL